MQVGLEPVGQEARAREPRARLTSTCGPAYAEVVVRFTAPATGLWELTTDGPATTCPTLIDVRERCGDGSTLVCQRGGAGRYGARTAVRLDAAETVVVVIHATTNGTRGWQLVAREVEV